MAEKNVGDRYICDICGQEVEIVTPTDVDLVCCGMPMTKE